MISQVAIQRDFLPGYQPLERLGSGGYGEVWKAEAPGGLVKAVKLIHGFSHEQRASDELKALERVKQVRHPFLLSLERIETIENRLFIVTELADQSLRDYFNDYVRRGKNGLPRTELLNYLRDAADALDFMSEVHGLQHLDIKPENLLLVAGHVKVADFGLVKDVQRQCVSLVGGLTPVYAAPEVYHGRPSRYSDQYSLAVVYQQMLTATLPFSGASAAELTLQHLNEAPDLSALPPRDRPAIARALSKNPEHRFASCRTMVDSLIEGADADATGEADGTHPAKDRSPSSAASSPSDRAPLDATLGRDYSFQEYTQDEDTAPSISSVTLNFANLEPPQTKLKDVPPFDADSFQAAPTLLIGIGGAAGHVLRNFKARIAERLGQTDGTPAIATLLIDTDASDLLQATHGNGAARLTQQETLAVPLRRPQEYRSRHGQPFRWLSRRWLYNVPRSLKTEGLRPLGRLAFVDHANTIRARLENALEQVLDPANVEQLAEQAGLPVTTERVQVYLVTSICGGTGSGMALDLAYMLQGLIEARGVQSALTGILLLQTPAQPRLRELAAVNAFAWLTEYNHFNRPGAAYPGDASCGLGPRDIDDRVFSNAYIVPLGQADRLEEVDGQASEIAEYLYLDALSPLRTALDACRREERATTAVGEYAAAGEYTAAGEHAPLGAFGMALRDVSRSPEVERVSMELVQKVLSGWLGVQQKTDVTEPPADVEAAARDFAADSQPRPLSRVERICAKEAATLQLEPRQLLALASKLLEVELRATPNAFFQRLALELRGSRETIDPHSIVQAVDRMFGGPPSTQDSPDAITILRKPLAEVVQPLVEKMEQHLSQWLYGRFDDPELRLPGALETAAWFTTHLRGIAKSLLAEDSRALQRVDEQRSVEAGSPAQAAASQETVFEYFVQRLNRAAIGAALEIARSLGRVASHVESELVAVGRSVRELAERHRKARPPASLPSSSGEDASAKEVRRTLAEAVVAQESRWLAAVNKTVQKEMAKERGGLCRVLRGEPEDREKLLVAVEQAARTSVSSAIADSNLLERVLGQGEAEMRESLESLFREAKPPCEDYGGAVYHLLAAPHDADARDLRERLAAVDEMRVAVVEHPENRLGVCTEVQNISLIHLALTLIRNRRDYAAFAERVLSRKDVPWSPLLMEPPPVGSDEPVMQTVVL